MHFCAVIPEDLGMHDLEFDEHETTISKDKNIPKCNAMAVIYIGAIGTENKIFYEITLNYSKTIRFV